VWVLSRFQGRSAEVARTVSSDEFRPRPILLFLQHLLCSRLRPRRSFLNYENSAGRGPDGLPLQKRQTMKRLYWYIDYHDFVLVVKYRLAVMRSRIEAGMVKVSLGVPGELSFSSSSERCCRHTGVEMLIYIRG
jgi:hypothetical protein